MIKQTPIVLLAVVAFFISIACKDAILGPSYPVTNLKEYDYIVIATVNNAVHDKQGYQPLKSFTATINKSLKGGLAIGTPIKGKAKIEEARAVCPLHLEENTEYLLLLNKSNDTCILSRFSFPVKKGYQYYDNYLKQLEILLHENGKQ